jgi:hypothetical protein
MKRSVSFVLFSKIGISSVSKEKTLDLLLKRH